MSNDGQKYLDELIGIANDLEARERVMEDLRLEYRGALNRLMDAEREFAAYPHESIDPATGKISVCPCCDTVLEIDDGELIDTGEELSPEERLGLEAMFQQDAMELDLMREQLYGIQERMDMARIAVGDSIDAARIIDSLMQQIDVEENNQVEDKVFLTPEELAARFSGVVSIRTLKDWRIAGKGPIFTKIGKNRVLYKLEAVVAWEREQERSKTEAGQ